MDNVVEFKPKAKAGSMSHRVEYKLNWGMIGALLFCLGFWGAVGTALYKYHTSMLEFWTQ